MVLSNTMKCFVLFGFNLAKLMGHKRSPQPYLFFLKIGLNTNLFRGVNFASGSSGLLDITGKDLVSLIVKSFETYQSFIYVVRQPLVNNLYLISSNTIEFVDRILYLCLSKSSNLKACAAF